MLTANHSVMNKDIFDRLPTTTNAVESHNRLSKNGKPDILRVAMMSMYKIDMSNVLEYLARMQGISTSYVDTTKPTATKRKCKVLADNEEEDGPPDKHRDFNEGMLIAEQCYNNFPTV